MVSQPKHCLACGYMPVKFPAVLCPHCAGTPQGFKAIKRYRKTRRPRGSVRAVSGGLPSLGRRR